MMVLLSISQVEAKKAVPRDDHQFLNKNSSNIHGSPVPGCHTKKIFVGGLSSTITEGDFKKYFDQFGTVTDVVVMYDHNTQRPRGFGFITYDSEDAVAKALLKTFHELNGEMVEVKRAVPKEASPGPIMRSSTGGYTYGLNRVNSSVNGYAQGYNPSSISGYGMRLDDRLGGSLARNPGFNTNLGYGRALNPYYSGNSSSLASRNVWENVALNHATKSAISNESMVSSRGGFGAANSNWGTGHPQDVTASQPAGDYRPRAGRRNVSLRWERDRGDKGEVFKREEGYLFRAGSFREQEPIGLQCQRRNPTPSRHGQPVRPAAGSQPSADSRWCGSRHLGAPPSRGRASEQKRTTRKNMSRHGKPHPANLPEPIQGQGTNT
ncbi:hypothetical protein BHM03_00013581 [Ensete ventricosum]|nr:hypothetical protein BHM03_00013581 [Ensete ventricosum]